MKQYVVIKAYKSVFEILRDSLCYHILHVYTIVSNDSMILGNAHSCSNKQDTALRGPSLSDLLGTELLGFFDNIFFSESSTCFSSSSTPGDSYVIY